jgi:capsular polysaccharide biosynthesis protein
VLGQKQDSDAPINLGADIQGLQQLTQTMAKAVGTCPTAEELIQELKLHEPARDFLGDLSVEQTGATQFLEISYKHTDPEQGKGIFNSPRDEFSEQVSDVSPTTNAIAATVWEQATVPDTPVSPNPAGERLLALMVETTLGMGLPSSLTSTIAGNHRRKRSSFLGCPFLVSSQDSKCSRLRKEMTSWLTSTTNAELVKSR